MRHVWRSLVVGLAGVALCASIPVGLGAAFMASGPSVEERAALLFSDQVAAWQDRALRERTNAALRAQNPEWDFMRRTFLVLSVADHALRHPEDSERWLELIDDVIDVTVAEEAQHGHAYFLLPYVHDGRFRDPQARSVFVDGEIALMLGARRLIADEPVLAEQHRARVATLVRAFEASPALLPESYPDEAWLFCNTNALVAVRMADVLDGTDHSSLIAAWTERAAEHLVEPGTGLLGSEFTWSGTPLDGPEGSSLWLVAINLRLLDPQLAQAQYEGGREALIGGLLGLGWASEWGRGFRGPVDVDSGPIVPFFDASPSSSGFALMASRAFGDEATFARLARSLRAADAILALDPRFRQIASNPMGDVVLLHALTFGPLWERLEDDATRDLSSALKRGS